jgi:hypothetical protein
MRPLPNSLAAIADNIAQWSNFHHTIADRPVAAYLTPGAAGLPVGSDGAVALAQALNAILTYCMADPPARLCTIGARWSLSNILDPGDVILDPGIWNQIAAVDSTWLTDDYKADVAPRGGLPVVAHGGTNIRTLNNFLGTYNLALQASGGSDGHRIAGCIATGTHGSHLKIGAVHDTVLGIYLVRGPTRLYSFSLRAGTSLRTSLNGFSRGPRFLPMTSRTMTCSMPPASPWAHSDSCTRW